MHPIVTFRMRNNRTPVVKNEMRTVENAKRNERHTGRIRDRYGTIATSKKTPPLKRAAVGINREEK